MDSAPLPTEERLRLCLHSAPPRPIFGDHETWFEIYEDWRTSARKLLIETEDGQ